MKEKLSKKNQSVEKVFQLIELMVQNGEPMRIMDISEQISQPNSTVLRYLNTLVSFGYVEQNPDTLKYGLTLKLARLGSMVSARYNMRDVIHPYLVELTNLFDESSCLAIEEDMEVVYIDIINGPDHMLKTTQRLGKRAPLYSTGIGKNLLLNYNDEKIDGMIAKKKLIELTKNTITTKAGLLEELEKVRKQGFALDDEECEIGVKCIAVPVRDYTGAVVAGISISGPISRMTDNKTDLIKKKMVQISKEVSVKLNYSDMQVV